MYEIYTYTYMYCEEYTMHIPAQSWLDFMVIANTWNHIILREVVCCMIKQQIIMAEILHTAVGPQAVDKPSTVAVFGFWCMRTDHSG